METKHTPGPWYETGNHQGLIISEATSANVAVAYDKKDAALIAAAPDLLEALTEIATLLSQHPEAERGNSKTHYAMHMARGAIAKTKGEQP